MFDKIVLPIDLNHPASWEKALPMALRLAGDNGEIHVLGIVHDIGAAMVASFLPADFETKALNHMETALEDFIAENLPEGAKASPHVGHGHVPETILTSARKIGADVIVMASHPPDELRSFLVGSAAEKVVRHSEIPVLVVR
ncbi:MAG: universal stress protein [Maritimibacter sp.]|nr:universal stress protein [Maritimibacter sp.]